MYDFITSEYFSMFFFWGNLWVFSRIFGGIITLQFQRICIFFPSWINYIIISETNWVFLLTSSLKSLRISQFYFLVYLKRPFHIPPTLLSASVCSVWDTLILSLCGQLAGGERSEAAGGRERSGDSLPGAGEHSDRTGKYLQTGECGECGQTADGLKDKPE